MPASQSRRTAPARRSLLRPLLPLTAALVLAAGGARAQAVGSITFQHFTLPNGLDVVLAPDHSSQVIAVSAWFDAGARRDPAGKGGLARLFERLMFAGTAHVPQGAHATVANDLGGRVSASVDAELARFTTVLPSSRLALGLWLEAERMRSLALNDTTVNDARLGLVEELRDQLQAQPYAAGITLATSALYDSTTCAGYAHPPTGTLQTITALSTADAQAFYRAWYAPNRARLVVAGDLDTAETRALVTQYFGDLPRGPEEPNDPCARPGAGASQQLTLSDRNAATAGVGLFYRIPGYDAADTPALELLEVILGQGSGGRLSAELLRGVHAAFGVQGGILGERRGPGAFGVFAIAAQGVTADSLRALLAAQAAWASGPGLTEVELERARHIFRAAAVSSRERPSDIAEALQHAATFLGDPAAVNSRTDRVLGTSLAEVRRVAASYLAPANALTLVVNPEVTP